jgi:hypothetical protein
MGIQVPTPILPSSARMNIFLCIAPKEYVWRCISDQMHVWKSILLDMYYWVVSTIWSNRTVEVVL